jgi:High potential iron-sulfur protein
MHITRMRITRRGIVARLGQAAALSAALPWTRARSAEPPRLDVKDPTAVALGYVENAAQVDLKKYPAYVSGSNCENCLQLQGTAGNNYRPCSLFPGKLVSVSGWCNSWTPEM